ncbi:MAG: CPBP family intramembrane glutamic endopeptidase, partial [Oscillospiraceae bacterium]
IIFYYVIKAMLKGTMTKICNSLLHCKKEIFVSFSCNIIALIAVCVLLSLLLYKKNPLKLIFQKSSKKITTICIPMFVISILTADFLFGLIKNVFSQVGINFLSAEYYLQNESFSINMIVFILIVITVTLEEILFRGIILNYLRKFDDSIAILISAFLFILLNSSFCNIVSSFFIGIVLGYFVVRSGSVVTAIISRIVFCGYMHFFFIIQNYISTQYYTLIFGAFNIAIMALAYIAFIVFSINDKKCFRLHDGELSIRKELIAFSTAPATIILIMVYMFSLLESFKNIYLK